MKKLGNTSLTLDPLQIHDQKDSFQENQLCHSNLVEVRPLNSTKHQSQIQRNFFKGKKDKKVLSNKIQSKLCQMEKEKQQLIESINILKKGAVMALEQKSEEIQSLKELDFEHQQNYQQLYSNYCRSQQISQNHSQLQEEFNREKNHLINELRQKQIVIEQLLEHIENMKNYVAQIQQNQDSQVQEINNLEAKIQSLNEQIEQYTLKKAVQDINTDIDDVKNTLMESTNSNKELGLTYSNLLEPLQDENALQQHYHNIIAKVENQHKQELAHLAQFYQNKIKTLRQHYDTYLRNELEEDINEFQMDIPSITKNQELRQFALNRSFSQKQNLCQMLPITEQANSNDLRSQYSTHNLQEEIISPSQYKDAENLSQFTKNHFDNPYSFWKQKSIPNFEKQYRSNLVRIQNKSTAESNQKEYKQEKDISVQVGHSEPSQKEKLWQKAKIFTTGLISGVSLTSLVSLAVRKKK